MSDGLDFQLDIESRLRGGDPLTELEQLEKRFTDLQSRYSAFEKEAEAVNVALEKNAKALDDTRVAMQRAMQEGNEKKFWQLAQKVQLLEAEETKLKTKAEAANAALAKQAKTLTHGADKVGALKKQEESRTKVLDIAQRRTEQFNGKLGSMIKGVRAASTDIEDMSSSLGSMGTIAAIGASATVLLVAAVIAVGAAFIAGAIAVDKYAISLANAKRNQEQTLRALTQNNDVAKQTNDAIEKISAGTGIASDRLVDLTKKLTLGRQQMGLAALKGNELESALYSAATAEQALGDSGAADQLVDQLNAGMLTADRLASRVQTKYGDVLQHKMLGLDQQMFRLHKNIDRLFSGLNIEPFLRGLSRMVDLFDVSTASGRAIKGLFEAIFGPTTGDMADKFFIFLERMILRTELKIVKLRITFQDLGATIDDIGDRIEKSQFGGALDTIKAAIDRTTPAIADAVIGFSPLATMFDYFATSIPLIVKGLEKLFSMQAELASWGKKAATAAGDFVQGLVNGLTGGAKLVDTAVRALGQVAIAGLKTALDSHSPSRKFFAIGMTAPEGMARGIESGASRVGAAVDDLVQLPRETPASSSSSSSKNEYKFEFNVQIIGSPSDEDLDRFEEKMLAVFDKASARMAAEAPAT